MLHTITRLLDKEILECDKDGGLIEYVVKQMQNQIANYVMNELSSRGECIFKLYPPEACDVASTNQYKIEQRISCVNLVRCRDCRHRDIDGYCNDLKYYVPGDDFFCKNGKEKDL